MVRNLVTIIVLTVLVVAQATNAQMPATMPSTAPAATVAADQTTPQGTLILLTRTMQNGDVAGARLLLHAATPDETILANLFVQAVEINSKFRAAVSKVFGDGVADSFVGSANDVSLAEQGIRSAKVDILNDSATVLARAGEEPVKLVRADGLWKLSMAAIGADEMEHTQRDLKIRLDVLSSIADDVAAGKFKSPDDMGDQMRSRLATEVLKAAVQTPATRPAAGK